MVVRIFIKEEGVDVQTIFIFEEARRRLDIFQLRSGCQALAQLTLHPVTLALFRLDQIDPDGGGQLVVFVFQLQSRQAAVVQFKCAQHSNTPHCRLNGTRQSAVPQHRTGGLNTETEFQR